MKNAIDYLAIQPAAKFREAVDNALACKAITEDEWYELNNRYFTDLYLSKDNPRAQSGHSGGEEHYVFSHLLLLEAIQKSGSLLDVGCANGYLIESLYKWANAVGFSLDVYGLDISEEIIGLAKARLPQWQDRFYIGNALTWAPEEKFDYICIKGFEYVPEDKQAMLFYHLMQNYLTESGRMIFGPYWYETEDQPLSFFNSIGTAPDGYAEKTHYQNPARKRKILWFDKHL